MGKIRRMGKGSFTVEMALLTPFILLVIFSSIYLCFYVHNRTWLTAAAYEAALTGSSGLNQEADSRKEIADMRIRERSKYGLMGAENLYSQVTVNGEITVTTDSDTIHPYGSLRWHLHTEGKSSIVDPVTFIRRAKGVGNLFDEDS